jgi:hypothetical protein
VTTHPIMDRAEVAIDLPNRLYRGSFDRDAAFEVRADGEEVHLRLVYSGEESRIASVHLHYFLLSDIIRETAQQIADDRPIDDDPPPLNWSAVYFSERRIKYGNEATQIRRDSLQATAG